MTIDVQVRIPFWAALKMRLAGLDIRKIVMQQFSRTLEPKSNVAMSEKFNDNIELENYLHDQIICMTNAERLELLEAIKKMFEKRDANRMKPI